MILAMMMMVIVGVYQQILSDDNFVRANSHHTFRFKIKDQVTKTSEKQAAPPHPVPKKTDVVVLTRVSCRGMRPKIDRIAVAIFEAILVIHLRQAAYVQCTIQSVW